mgnify:CR=1 FL=1
METLNYETLLQDRLKQSSIQLVEIKSQLDIPPVTQEQIQKVQDAKLPKALKRLVFFLFENQGARSDVISANCAIGNVSDVHTPDKRVAMLEALGLKIECKTLKACNRYGEFTIIGHLFIQPLPDNELWRRYAAANDAICAN